MEKIDELLKQFFPCEDDQQSIQNITQWLKTLHDNREDNDHIDLTLVDQSHENMEQLLNSLNDLKIGQFDLKFDEKTGGHQKTHILFNSALKKKSQDDESNKELQSTAIEEIQTHFQLLEENGVIERIDPKSFTLQNLCKNNTIQIEDKIFYCFSTFVAHPSLFPNEDYWQLIISPPSEKSNLECEKDDEVIEVPDKDIPNEDDGCFIDKPTLGFISRYICTFNYDKENKLESISLTLSNEHDDDTNKIKKHHEDSFRYHYKVHQSINTKFTEMEEIANKKDGENKRDQKKM
tara:strand:+ start:269 stop:1144 length:876 start_codon:yes stop_codon:yes gene_type:complete